MLCFWAYTIEIRACNYLNLDPSTKEVELRKDSYLDFNLYCGKKITKKFKFNTNIFDGFGKTLKDSIFDFLII